MDSRAQSLLWVLLVFGSSVMLAVTGCDDRVALVSCCTTTVRICCLKTLRVPPNLVWEQSCSSLLFTAVCFIFRLAVAVLPQFMLICEKISLYIHAYNSGQRLRLRRFGLASYDGIVSCESAARSDTLRD